MKKRNILFIFILLIIIVLSFIIFFCPKKDTKIKYVFLFIGDGMGSTQVELTNLYLNYRNENELVFLDFPANGSRINYSGDSDIPDSSSSASILASGALVNNTVLNIDIYGNKLIPITYDLKNKGMKIGIITNVGINHATPAAFYASNSSRTNYLEILSDLEKSNFDFFAGSNIIEITESSMKSLLNSGYEVVYDTSKLSSIKNNILLSPNSSIDFLIDRKNNNSISLASYLESCIKTIDNNNGFFIMIESGMIDYAGHNNDSRSIISEVVELNSSILIALDFYNKHKDETLIIVTGDHETGGLVLNDVNFNSLSKQKISYVSFDNYLNEAYKDKLDYSYIATYILNNFGLDVRENLELKNLYKSNMLLDLRKKVINMVSINSNLYFAATNHTGSNIPVYSIGTFSNKFNGLYDSVTFNKKLRNILNRV